MNQITTESMGSYWIAYQSEPNNQCVEDLFAREVIKACRRRLPEGRLSGVLQGRESDVRQDALQMLFARYLRRNKWLESATRAGDCDTAERSLNASISACVYFALRRHARKVYAEAAHYVPIELVQPPPSCQPVLENPETQESTEAILKSRALIEAFNNGKITPRNYRIAAMAIDHGMPAKPIAEIEGVSPSAIYQQLRRIAPTLREAKSQLEAV